MKIPKKYSLYLLLVFVPAFSFFQPEVGSKKRTASEYQGEILIAGLESDVTVIRDQRGLPHIYAGNEHDLYFAVGYVSAQDRLWQMDLIRRVFSGRLAEIFGKKYVEADLFSRCLDIPSKSRMIIANGNPDVIKCLEAYAEGVNYYISSAGKNLPTEFRILSYQPEKWKTEDIAGIIGLISWTLAEKNLQAELFNYKLVQKVGSEKAASLIPEGHKEDNLVFPDFKSVSAAIDDAELFRRSYEKLYDLGIRSYPASNNWVVSGSKSSTGKPIFSNDMHLAINSPGIWMQMHQVIPGKLNVTGVLIPGEPFIVAGHNDKIAWGVTNMMVDDIDLFAEKVSEDDGKSYYFNGEWKEISERNEIIRIKGRKEEIFTIRSTHRGPIISELKGIKEDALSMKWSGFDSSDEFRTFYMINRAEGWDDFRSALETFRSLGQNFAFADNDGNIGLTSAGGIPVRKNCGNLIRDGQTDEYDWVGYVPFDQLPYSYNPGNGYVSSANNKTVGDDYPYYINNCFGTPFRINRIREMLEEKEILGMDDFKRMINDQHSNCVRHLMPFLNHLASNPEKLESFEKEAIDRLSGWDNEMNKELVAPSIFEYFRLNLAKNLLGDELGDLFKGICLNVADNYLHLISDSLSSEWIDNVNTTEVESIDDIVLVSFKDCVREMTKLYGRNMDKWKWGNIHKMILEHPLGTSKVINSIYKFNSDEYPVGGSDHTVSMFCSFEPGFKVNVGASVKNIYNTANWDESVSVIPSGQSGIPGSEFYLSQTKTYTQGGFYMDLFSEKAVKADAKYTLVLKKP